MALPKPLNLNDLQPFLANPEQLQEQTVELQLAIANYPDTPRNLLKLLANSSHSLVAAAASHHVNLAGEITENWQQIADATLSTTELRQNDRLAVELLKIAPVADYFLSEWVPASYLTQALKNPHLPLRYRLKYLERLSREPDLEPRLQVAESLETPVPVLEMLAGDLELPIRTAVKSNSNTPPELIELVEGQLTVAKDWNTDPEQLANLGESRWPLIRLAVAQNPATSGETLMQLAGDEVFKIRFAVAKNPETPANVLAVLAENSAKEINSAVARHPHATEEILHQLFPTQKDVLRGRENLPASILERFFQEAATDEPIWKQDDLRYLLLEQPNTPTWMLAELANVDIEAVRAENEALKPRNSKVLETWVRDEIWFLADVAEHPQVSVEILEQLSDCPHPKVQLAVAQNSRTPENLRNQILLRLALGNDEKIVRAIASSPKTPVFILERLISTSTTGNQAAKLAKQMVPSISENLLEKIINFVNKYKSPQRILSRLRDESYREPVLAEWRQLLASLNESERATLEPLCKIMLPAIGLGGGLPRQDLWLEKYPSLTGGEFYLYGLLALLGLAVENTGNRSISLALLSNPKTPQPLREELKEQFITISSTNKNLTDVVGALAYNLAIPEPERLEYLRQLLLMRRSNESIARNPKTPPEILTELMTKGGRIRQVISTNPNTPTRALAELAQDSNKTIRAEVAKNPGTPLEILLQLATKPLENSKSGTSTIWEKVLNNPSLPPLERYRLLVEKEELQETVKAQEFMSKRPQSLAEVLKSNNIKALQNIARSLQTPINILEQLAEHPDEYVRSALLDNQNLPRATLRELARDSSDSIRRSLGHKHSKHTPVEILEMLADDRSEGVRAVVAENPQTSVETLVKLANDSSNYVKQKLVSNRNTPVEIIERLALEEGIFNIDNAKTPAKAIEAVVRKIPKHRSDKELVDLLKYPVEGSQMPASLLEELAEHHSELVRDLVIQHPNTPLRVIEKLANENYIPAVHAIAKNANTPSHILEELATNPDYTTCYNLAFNSNTPATALEKLVLYKEDELKRRILGAHNNEIWRALARNTRTPITVLDMLADREFYGEEKEECHHYIIPPRTVEEVLESLALNPNLTPSILAKLAGDPSAKIRSLLIRHPNLTSELWQQLAQDEDQDMREYIASTIITPIHILETLALDTDTEVRRKVAVNPNTPTTTLEILSQDSIGEVRTAVAGNQNTNVIVLEQLGQDEKVEVRRAVAQNPNTPVSLRESLRDLLALPYTPEPNPTLSGLSRIYKPDQDDLPTLLSEYAESDNPFVRFVTLMHPLTPVDSITEGYQSLLWQERYAIAENPSTPGEIRQQLAKDGNRIVRATAKANIMSGNIGIV
ncbi:MAG: hypothetical protein AB4080_26360 [Trichodesmium sp.]